MKKALSPAEATERLEILCARSEQCSADIRRKLYNWGIGSSQSQRIIERLEQDRYIDDSRFAKAYVRDKYRFSAWGRIKITAGLIAKRIPRHIIDEALLEIDSRTYALTAFKAIRSKLRTLPPDMPRYDIRARLMRFALSRGYESSLSLRIIDSQRLWQE